MKKDLVKGVCLEPLKKNEMGKLKGGFITYVTKENRKIEDQTVAVAVAEDSTCGCGCSEGLEQSAT